MMLFFISFFSSLAQITQALSVIDEEHYRNFSKTYLMDKQLGSVRHGHGPYDHFFDPTCAYPSQSRKCNSIGLPSIGGGTSSSSRTTNGTSFDDGPEDAENRGGNGRTPHWNWTELSEKNQKKILKKALKKLWKYGRKAPKGWVGIFVDSVLPTTIGNNDGVKAESASVYDKGGNQMGRTEVPLDWEPASNQDGQIINNRVDRSESPSETNTNTSSQEVEADPGNGTPMTTP